MNLRKWWNVLISVILSAVFLLSAIKIVYSQDYADTDFFSFWLAGHSSLLGEDPYSSEWWIDSHVKFGAEWISDPTFLYPLPLAMLFIPLGFFSLDQAFILWVFLSQVMIVISTLLLMSLWNWSKVRNYLLPIFAGIFLFRPVIVTLLYGQLGAVFLLLLVLIIILWERGKWLQGGILLPFLALKPSFGILIITLLSLWILIQKKWRALVGIICASIGLFLLGWIQNPNWVTDFLAIGTGKLSQTFGYSPTFWGVSFITCNRSIKCSLILGSLMSSLLVITTIYFLLQRRFNLNPSLAVSFVIPITLLITPYSWAYDQILLIIPIVVVMILMMKNGYPYLFTASVFLMISLLALGFLFIATKLELDVWSAGVVFVCELLVIWGILVYGRTSYDDIEPHRQGNH